MEDIYLIHPQTAVKKGVQTPATNLIVQEQQEHIKDPFVAVQTTLRMTEVKYAVQAEHLFLQTPLHQKPLVLPGAVTVAIHEEAPHVV